MAYNYKVGAWPASEQFAGGGRTYTTAPTALGPWTGGTQAGKSFPELNPILDPRNAPGTSRYRTPTTTNTGNPDWQRTDLWKNPSAEQPIANLWDSFNKGASTLPNFSDTLAEYVKGQQGANQDVATKYAGLVGPEAATRYQASNENLDKLYADLINSQSSRYRDIAGNYDQSIADYQKQGLGALAGEDAATAALVAQYMANKDRAVAEQNKQFSRYGMSTAASGGPQGWSSGNDSWLGTAYANAMAPYDERAYQAKAAVAAKYLPFYGDVASRYANLAPFQLGTEQAITNAQGSVIGQQRQTSNSTLELQIKLAQGAFDNAIRNAAQTGIGAQYLAQLYGLDPQLISQRAQAIGSILSLEGAAKDTTFKYLPGAVETLPQYPTSYEPAYLNASGQIAGPQGGTGSRYSPQGQAQPQGQTQTTTEQILNYGPPAATYGYQGGIPRRGIPDRTATTLVNYPLQEEKYWQWLQNQPYTTTATESSIPSYWPEGQG